MRRVVITGMGVVSPLGCDLSVFWDRIKAGRSGIKRIERFDAGEGYAAKIAGEVIEFNPDSFMPAKEQRRLDRFTIFAMAASDLAMKDSGIDMNAEDPEKVGVIIGSGIGGLELLQAQHTVLLEKGPARCSPFMIPSMISNMAGGMVAIRHNMKGPNYCVVSACASSAHSIGDAMRIIQRGDADVMISGGSEASICELGIAGFCALRALSTRNDEPEKASRPFDKERDGFIMAEGSGIIVLEEMERAQKRGAKIYGELAGCGMTCDAFHMTAPTEDGAGAAKAMKLAMADAKLGPDQVDYVNAHGTSTQLNDKMETKAIKTAFGEDRAREIMVSSSKSMLGHTLGAAGCVELIVCALALRDGIVPPTTNYTTPDPECDLDYVPNTSREKQMNACISNSLGFGGHNACLLLKKLG